ncbi:MAG: hypothetical protein CVU05_13240 [Bacteroidetes bacterium HGW-Bacteroidetes-21]|jgi:hypothetical protein|nr:MAG: hypothetical protein CVU05_13240 [Bacteroidetes bacterium HGW-Bacteroidetes-21]
MYFKQLNLKLRVKPINILKVLPVIVFAGILFSCNDSFEKEEKENVLARYKEAFLYKSEIAAQYPNLNGADSTEFIRQYIDKWIREQVLLHLANTNLSSEEKDITKEVEEFKNSMLIYKYQQEFIKQNLDTTFSNEELEEYYNQHFDDYFLSENVLQALFIQLPKSAPRPDIVKRFYMSEKPSDIEKLDAYCNKNAFKYDDFRNKWVSFDQVQRYLPEIIADQETFLRTNRFIEMADSNFYYFLKIKDFKIKGEHAPLDFAIEMIKPALINKRKNELIINLEVSSYKDAIQNNDAEIIIK